MTHFEKLANAYTAHHYEFAPRTTYTAPNGKFIVEITHCESDIKSPRSLPLAWFKAGRIPQPYARFLHVTTYCFHADGSCHGEHNPMIDYAHQQIDFDWLLPDTPENERAILVEAVRRYETGI